MVLASNLIKLTQTEFVKSFEIVIQLGAILAIVGLYFKRLWRRWQLWLKIMVAFVPTGIVGLILYRYIKDWLIGNTLVTLAALLIGGVVLIGFEKVYKRQAGKITRIEDLSLVRCLGIGMAQSVSVIPGVSRAAATIIGGLVVGYDRVTAVEFSFLLAIPTMAAATALDLVKSQLSFSGQEIELLLIGFVGAFVTAWVTVKYFVKLVKTHTLAGFGVYRVLLAVVYWLVVR